MEGQSQRRQDPKDSLYESSLTANIMITAIVVLFCLLILMLCLHFYARWYLRRTRRGHHHRRRHLVFYVDSVTSDVPSRGLDASVLQSLPVFLYSSSTHPHSEPVECAVCLSEFEENEAGRVLPKCNHSFHVDCIDMWFQSHSTCPLCRTLVESAPGDQTVSEVLIDVCEPARPETGSSSELFAECQHDGEGENRTGHTLSSSSSSIGLRRKPSTLVGVTIEVPTTRSFRRGDDESGCSSPSTQSSFTSSMSRILSFKRVLSRERKASLSPSSVGCSSMTEFGRERGGRDETQRVEERGVGVW